MKTFTFSPRLLLAVLLGLTASACVTPGARTPLRPVVDVAALGVAGTTTPAPALNDAWWQAFGDPQLDALMTEALSASPTLALARARVAQAEAAAESIGTPRRPNVDGVGSLTRQRYSATGLFPPPLSGTNFTDAQLGLSLNWDLDLWGRQRSTLAAAQLRTRAAEVDATAARLLLTTSLVKAYLAFDHACHVRHTAESSRASRAALLALTTDRRRAGLDTDVEVETARAAVSSAEGDIALADEEIVLARNAVAALAGAGPARGASLGEPTILAGAPLPLPADLPADLVARRPDIAADRLRIDAVGNEIDAARAAFYPNVNIAALIGLDTITPREILNGSSRFFNIGPAFNLPVYGHGALRGNLHGAEASYDQAVETYNGAVVGAFHEVADALASLRALDREESAALAAQSSLERAFTLAELRYKSGLANYLGVLVAQDRLLAQQRLVVDVQSRRADLTVDLVRALGGGYRSKTDSTE